jgi:hypothetical protein
MFVLKIEAGAKPIEVDSGGQLIRWSYDILGKADFPSGIPKVITPIWSPDGRWIAFLKRFDGSTQVWRANADGSGSEQLTRFNGDIESFSI